MNELIPLFGDNIAAEDWASKNCVPKRAKHLSVRYFFIQEHIQNGEIMTAHVNSSENRADGFTKPLPREKFDKFRKSIGVLLLPKDHQGGVLETIATI